MVSQDDPRLPSQLRTDEWMELELADPLFRVRFSREGTRLEASLYRVDGDECDVTIDEEALDRWFLDLGRAGCRIHATRFTLPEKRKPWEV